MASHNDASNEEWQGNEGVNRDASRYPVHDACEFENAEALRQLIFVPLFDESSVSSDNSTTTSSSTSSNQYKHQDATNPEVKSHSLPAQAALLTQQTGNGEITTPPSLFNGTSTLNIEFRDGSIPGLRSVGGALKLKPGYENTSQYDFPQPDNEIATDEMQIDRYDKCVGDIVMLEKSKILPDPPEECVQQVSPETPAGKADDIRKERKKKNKFSCPYDLDDRDDDENTPLHIAIHARKINNVRILLEAGATVHKKCDGSAPIHLAISLGAIAAHAEFAKNCVDLLLEYKSDMTMRDDSFHTPLYLACVSNLCPVVQMLLNDPLSKETLNLRADRTGGRALHAAAKCDDIRRGVTRGGKGCVTELLLAAEKIAIDVQNNYGRTPLHIAALCGNWHVARLLINAGADTHILDKRGHSPGQRARKRGMVIPNDLKVLGEDAPTRDLIMDPDGSTLILCHELCIQHRTCPPIVRGDVETPEPPPENVRRLNVLINDDDGILRCGEFSGCKWYTDVRRAALSDVLKVHEYPYIERMSKLCSATPDHPRAIQTLDADTTVSHWSFEAALRAAGSVCEAVDKVMAGDVRNAFCAIRPPGHHAGPRGIVTCPNDPDGSHGFCLLNNVAIGASYARSMYRNDGIKKIAIIDFDVHHGNGTEEIVRQLTPVVEHAMIRTPFAVGGLHASTYKPWLDENDIKEVFFASTHGYGPRDRQLLPGAVQGGWFYPASGKTYKSKSLTSPSDVETPNLSDFLMSQTWARLGDDYRNNCCKIIDIGLSLPLKDDTYNHGLQRLELRDAYRKSVIPSLLEFDPDMIFISAGFDAHRRDTMNFGYVGMIEEDYEWLTEQLVKVANTCCNGRVVSALEGGYKIHGGIVSPFARSVASHVRALVDGGNSREEYDMEEGDWESCFERHMNEEKEKKRQMKVVRQSRAPEGQQHVTPYQSHVPSDNLHNIHHAPAENEDVSHLGEMSHNDDGNNDEPSRKRTRKQVDYKYLFEQMKKEGF